MKQLTAEQKSKDHNLNQWHIVQRSPLSNRIEDETGFVVAVVWHTQADVDAGLTGKTNSNAQLLVASRELLAALQQIVRKHYLRDGKHEDAQVHPDLIEQARQAINKAIGKA